MKVIKIAAVIASSFLIALLFLITKVENPEVALYKKTIEMLMEQEGIATKQEVEEQFPILIDIKSTMNQIANMNEFVLSKTRNPAPILTEAEALQLVHYIKRIPQLREQVQEELTQLMTTYVAFLP